MVTSFKSPHFTLNPILSSNSFQSLQFHTVSWPPTVRLHQLMIEIYICTVLMMSSYAIMQISVVVMQEVTMFYLLNGVNFALW